MKSSYLLFVFLFFVTSAQAQKVYSCTDFDVNHKKNEWLKLVGESGDNFIVQKLVYPMYYEKKTNLYLLDKTFKIIKHEEVSTQYKTGRGGHQPVDAKSFMTFNDKLIGYYSVKEKKDAVIYYDEYDPATFELKSEKNELFRHTYPKLVNARDWLSISEFQYGNELVLHITVYGIEGGISAGNHEGYVVRYDKDLKQKTNSKYLLNDIGQCYDIELLENGDLAFLSFEKDGDKFFISTVNSTGDLNSSSYSKGDKYFDYWSHDLIKGSSGDFVFAGLYSDTEYKDKENPTFQGVYLTKKGSEKMKYVSFKSLSSDFEFESDGYLKRKDGEAEMDTYFNENTNSAFIIIYNTGKVTSAKIGVIGYNFTNDKIIAKQFEIPSGKFVYYTTETLDDKMIIRLIVSDEYKTINLSLNPEDLSGGNWETKPFEKVGNNYSVPFDCELDCKENYFMLIDQNGFNGVMKIME